MQEDFDDNCEELIILRWFRDKYVFKEDITHYYKAAPLIVEKIANSKDSKQIYNYIYETIVKECVIAIKEGDYDFAYTRYKNSVLALENEFIKQNTNNRLTEFIRKRSF